MLIGAALAAVPLALMSLALFGLSLPNLSGSEHAADQFQRPQRGRHAVGSAAARRACSGWPTWRWWSASCCCCAGGATGSRAGWATLALIASLAWLMPWYVIWVLPLAALGTSLRLRRAALALTVFLVAHLRAVAGNSSQSSASTRSASRSGTPRAPCRRSLAR